MRLNHPAPARTHEPVTHEPVYGLPDRHERGTLEFEPEVQQFTVVAGGP